MEESERMLEVLEETPEILKRQGIENIYRMKKSVQPKNPASIHGTNVVVYDEAFEKD